MKISSFEQFLVLKKNIWAWQSMEHDHLIKLSITFQQKDQCEIWWELAKWFLKNHDFIHVNSTVAGKYYKYKPDDGHLRFPIRTTLTTVDLKFTSILSILDKVPSGARIPPDQRYRQFLKSTKYIALTLEMAGWMNSMLIAISPKPLGRRITKFNKRSWW